MEKGDMVRNDQKDQGMKEIELVAKVAYEMSGEQIVVMDMAAIGYNVTDYFVIITGFTKEHMQAIADKIQETLYKELNIFVDHVEGYDGGWWILLDYMNFIVHIMSEDARNYYMLEQLWGDAPTWRFPEDFYAENAEGTDQADN